MNGHITYATKFSTDIERFQKIAENQNLSKTDLRVFIFLCCRLNSQHFLKVDKSQISETLGVSKKKIDESLDNLCDNGILFRGSDAHTKSGYVLVYTSNAMSITSID